MKSILLSIVVSLFVLSEIEKNQKYQHWFIYSDPLEFGIPYYSLEPNPDTAIHRQVYYMVYLGRPTSEPL